MKKTALFFLPLVTTACVNVLPPETQRPEQIILQESYVKKEGAATYKGWTKIQRPRVPIWLDTHTLYVKEEYKIQPIADLEWVARLGDYIHQIMLKYITALGLFEGLGYENEGFDEKYILTPSIDAFWVEKKESLYEAVVHMGMKLMNSVDRRICAHSSYECRRPLKAWHRREVIQGLESCLTESLKIVLQDLKSKGILTDD